MRDRRRSALRPGKSNVRGCDDGIAICAVVVAFILLALDGGRSLAHWAMQTTLALASLTALIFGFRAYRRRVQS